MSGKRIWIMAVGLALALGGTPAATADGATDDLEVFRGELLEYISGLQALPLGVLQAVYEEPISLADAKRGIEHLGPGELSQLRYALEQVPYWRELPRILASTLPAEDYYSPLELASVLGAGVPTFGPEQARLELLDFLDRLDALPSSVVSGDYHARVARVRASLGGLDAADVMRLRASILSRKPAWDEALRSGGAVRLKTTDDCTTLSFPNDILCEIDHIIDEIAAFGEEVAQFATDAFNAVVSGIESLFNTVTDTFNAIRDDPGALLDFIEAGLEATTGQELDLSDPSWLVDVADSFPLLDLPCPSTGTFIPGIGTLGTTEARWVCTRSIEWIAKALYDNAPDDVWGVPIKVIMAAVFYPINYLCLCFEAASEIEFDAVQAVHRDLVASTFGACSGSGAPCVSDDDCAGSCVFSNMSSRASQASVDLLQGSLNTLSASVAGVQTQVDGAQASVADLDLDVASVEGKLDANLDAMVSTRATQTSVDILDQSVAQGEAKLDVLDMEFDDLIDQEADQADFLLDFQELMLRLRIEADLIREGNDRISLFQLPGGVGGLLETTREIVEETIVTREAAGRDTTQARTELDRGDEAVLAGDFKDAYSHYRKAYQHAVQG